MLASGIIATAIKWWMPEALFSTKMLLTVGISTPIWLAATYLTAPVSDQTLTRFAEKVQPGRLGWSHIYDQAGFEHAPYLMTSLRGWATASVAVFSTSFSIGAFLLQRPELGLGLSALATVSGALTWRWVRREAGMTSPES